MTVFTTSELDGLSLCTGLNKTTILNLLYRRVFYVDAPENIHDTAIIADGAVLTGDVRIGPGTVVFYNTMIQADKAPVSIGERCCIVDGVAMHNHVEIGDYVHIAHNCLIHRRGTQGTLTIGSGTLVGFGSQVHASIGKGCQIAPGTIVDRPVPDHHFVLDKHLGDGLRQTLVSPMRPANYRRIQEMYKDFWGRKIIFRGSLVPLMWWDRASGANPGLDDALQALEGIFREKELS